jgi:type VII secretion integral membrane protein EccD
MCRLVVCGPDRRIDVAVPDQVVIADLLPALLRQLGDNLADTGLAHGGWVLQRLGAPALDENGTVRSLGLLDGDVVHLRPRAEQIPPVAFDDMIDGVAAGLRERSGKWQPEMTRWAALGSLAVLLTAGVVAICLPMAPSARALAGGLTMVALAVAAAVTGRVADDRPTALLLGAGVVGYAVPVGLSLPDLSQPAAGPHLGGPHLFTAAVAAGVAVLGAGLAVGAVRLAVVTAALGAGLGGLGAAAVAFLDAPVVAAAGAVAVGATVTGTMVPTAAFRMAGLRLKPLPTEPEHLQEDIEPEPSEPLLTGAATADRYMTALYIGLAVPAAAGLVLLAGEPRWDTLTLILLVASIRLLALRPMTSAWHRLAQGVPAVVGLCAALIGALTALPPGARPYAAVLVLLASGLLVGAARVLPGRRLMPYWGRVGDLAQTAATVAVVPVLLQVFGVYARVRAIGG